jgi:hypothetical protein
MKVSDKLHAPVALPPTGKSPPWTHRIGDRTDPKAGLVTAEQEQIFAPVGNRTLAVQPVSRRYTD